MDNSSGNLVIDTSPSHEEEEEEEDDHQGAAADQPAVMMEIPLEEAEATPPRRSLRKWGIGSD